MKATAQQYAQAWYEALKEAKPAQWAQISQSMLKQLQRDGSLSLLASIRRNVEELDQDERGTVRVRVTSAHTLDQKLIADLVKQLLGKEAEIENDTDPKLLSGIIVQTANRRWDLSARGQLKQLKQRLNS